RPAPPSPVAEAPPQRDPARVTAGRRGGGGTGGEVGAVTPRPGPGRPHRAGASERACQRVAAAAQFLGSGTGTPRIAGPARRRPAPAASASRGGAAASPGPGRVPPAVPRPRAPA